MMYTQLDKPHQTVRMTHGLLYYGYFVDDDKKDLRLFMYGFSTDGVRNNKYTLYIDILSGEVFGSSKVYVTSQAEIVDAVAVR